MQRAHVIALRSEADFKRAGALPPESFSVSYHASDDPALPALMKRAAALVLPAVGPKLPATLFDGTSIRLAQVTGAGVDRLDQATLVRLGIAVANVPGGSNSAVAEYAVTAASMLLRRFAWADREIKSGSYGEFRVRMMNDNLGGLYGCTVGVIGLGTIGMAVARAFAAQGANLVYFDSQPRSPAESAAIGARLLPLNELLRVSDVVTLHVPLLPETKHLIGGQQLAAMKPGAVLINAARGGIVDEPALAASLQSGHLSGAAVDVYSIEPPAPDNPLLKVTGEAAHRLLLTPHIAGVTRQASSYLLRSAWQNVERVLRGEAPLHRVY